MSAAVAAAAAAAAIGNRCYSSNNNNSTTTTTNSSNLYGTSQNLNLNNNNMFLTPPSAAATPSRYESQKRRDWNTFGQYLKNHKPPLTLSRCSGAHVLEFLRYLDQFGKTKVHVDTCQFFGHANHPVPCPCPLKQAWGSLDAVIGRLRAAFEEHGGLPERNPFGARAVRLYLREVRDSQARARGIVYEKKRKNKSPVRQPQYNYGTASSASLIGGLQYYTDVNSSYASPYNNGGRSYGNYLQHGRAL